MQASADETKPQHELGHGGTRDLDVGSVALSLRWASGETETSAGNVKLSLESVVDELVRGLVDLVSNRRAAELGRLDLPLLLLPLKHALSSEVLDAASFELPGLRADSR